MWYWTSLFLGHTRCDDLSGALPNGLNELEETNMIEISINRPDTNLKLFSEVQNERQTFVIHWHWVMQPALESWVLEPLKQALRSHYGIYPKKSF